MLFDDISVEKFAQIRGDEKWEEGHQQGLTEGLQQGHQQGLSRVNQLNQRLSEDGRIDDLIKASNDSKFQEELFEEYGL